MSSKLMRFMFLVQGEGRGHMTQAMQLYKILKSNGHEVVHTFIGKSNRRKIPSYFYENMNDSVEELISPNFVLDKNNKSLNLTKTIFYNARYLGTYYRSLNTIHKKVKSLKPDVIVNFYDFLGGFYFLLFRPRNVKHVSIGHQFLTHHPDFPFAKNRFFEKTLFKTNNFITSMRSTKYLALSFRPYEPEKTGRTVVVPPLLKEGIEEMKTERQNFILAYMVNDGYAEEIIEWHKNNPETEIHCFWDRKNMPEAYTPHPNLYFHQINFDLFSDYMRKCKAYISTAGFESVCEAMYLDKPIMMIPVEGQYEQACNAIDAGITGAGIESDHFDISALLEYLPSHKNIGDSFKKWVAKTESILLRELTNL